MKSVGGYSGCGQWVWSVGGTSEVWSAVGASGCGRWVWLVDVASG